MSARPGGTLQINLAPTHLPHARHILPHQLRQWAGQVDEVLLTLDLHRSGGRFSEAWAERLPGMRDLVDRSCAQYPAARLAEVDYSAGVAAEIARRFFGGRPVPAQDWNGGAVFSLLFRPPPPAQHHRLPPDPAPDVRGWGQDGACGRAHPCSA